MALALAIAASVSASADESWIGRWAIHPDGCKVDGDTAETAPLVATKTTLRWFVAACSIRNVYKAGNDVHIRARCRNEGSTGNIAVVLRPNGDRLAVTWDGSAVSEMRRCR